jgi:hypothetical protein
MADFGDLGDETDDGTGKERQAAGQDLAIRRSLLSPPGLPSILPGGSVTEENGPAIAPQPPILSGPLDRDVHAEVLRDILDAQARLPPLASSDPANWDGGWLDPPASLIAGPLDTDTHAEVLGDIQNAQAQLPPASQPTSPVARSRSAAAPAPTSYQLLYNDGRAGQIPSLFSTSAGPAQLPKFAAGYGMQLNTDGPAPIWRDGQQFSWIETPTGTQLVPYATMSARTGSSGLSPGDRLGLLFGNPVSAIASTVAGLTGSSPSTQDAILAGGSAVETPLYAAGSIGLSTPARATEAAGGPYSNLIDPPSVGPGKPYTKTQRANIYQQNMRANGGVLRSDVTGRELVMSSKSRSGVTPPENEAQIDHMNPLVPPDPTATPGSNSYRNALVLSRVHNRKKSNN